MKLPGLGDFDFKRKRVLVRSDLDVPIENGKVADETRLRECLPTIKYLLEHGAKVILMGHLGRPLRQAQGKLEGKVAKELSLRPVAQKFAELLNAKRKKPLLRNSFGIQNSKLQFKIKNFLAYQIDENIFLLENLRFDPREEGNDLNFAKELAGLGDFYVNEAFAASHREHSSIVGVLKFLPYCAGFHFVSEVENLSKVLENPQKPLVFVIGGAKPETKLPLVADFARTADWVLVGGTLCQMSKRKSQSASWRTKFKNIIFADLIESGFDISIKSIKEFSEIIKNAGTIVWNGPMGKYESEKWEVGTRKIAEAIANSAAFKVVGGGDTIAALTKFGLLGKMDYVSTGGGAMLEFLAKGTLPGIEALK